MLCGSRAIKGTLGIDKVLDISAEEITNYFNLFILYKEMIHIFCGFSQMFNKM